MKHLLILVAVLTILGCGPTAHIEKDESINFSAPKTYSWVEDSKDSTSAILSDIQISNLQNSVNEHLNKKGWVLDNKMPDIILKHDILVEKTIKEQNDPVYSQPFYRTLYNPYTGRWINVYYPSRFLGYDRSQYTAREGTLTISMIDTKTDKVVWQGWTVTNVGSTRLTSNEVTNAAKAILKKF